MQFIEMSGHTLLKVVTPDELTPETLSKVGVKDSSIVRVNRQGDLEVRGPHGWELIGGLLGDFEARIKHKTGLDWGEPCA